MKRKSNAISQMAITLLAVMVFCAVNSSFAFTNAGAATLFSGKGTADEPYLLCSADDLVKLSECVNGGEDTFEDQYLSLANDIDMSGISFIPIGVYGEEHYFSGTLDGNGYAIRNLSINIPGGNNGLFGMLDGTVVNLEVDGGTLSGANCGVISSHAAGSKARVLNCLTRNVTVNASRAGGIVDNFKGSVINCISYNCILNGSSSFGGIASYGISGDSYGNHYLLSAIDTSINAEKKDVDGCSELTESDDRRAIAAQLNGNYRVHAVFPASDYGICNEWAADDSRGLDITATKQRDIFQTNIEKLSGTGTFKDPYIIQSADELCILRDAVNSGNDFYGKYVAQTADIDLSGELWTPIGQYGSEKYFYGSYDGRGHTLNHIKTLKSGNNGFFGMLGGTVANLGIESGTIRGHNCGGITSHAAVSSATIVNCYNKATVKCDSRSGGIADNFSGSIIGCWSDCGLKGKTPGGIASYRANAIEYCNTSFDIVVPEDTMTGEMTESLASVKLSGEKAGATIDVLNSNLEEVKRLSGVRLKLYPYVISDGEIRFADTPSSFDLWKWILNHTILAVTIILCVAVYLSLVFRAGSNRDGRKWWMRFLLAFAPIFLFSYMFLIHSPVEFFISNNTEFEFVLGDFAYKYALLAIGLSVVISALAAFVRGIVCDVIACAAMGLDLCMYIQLNFLNGSLGLLDGNKKAVDIAGNYVNAGIWLLLFLLPFVLFFVLKKYRTRVIVMLCGALCVMQAASIASLLIQSPKSVFERETSQYYLSANDQFTVSADKNIIILVVDAYSNSYIGEFFENYPEVKDVVKDFTYYNNADCHYEVSEFSINYIVSGTEWDPSIKIDDWCETALDNERTNTFYARLAEKGYIFNLYSGQIGALSKTAKQDAVGKVANMLQIDCIFEVNDEIMFGLFTRASLYRFAPMLFKGALEFTAGDYSGAYKVLSKGKQGINTHLSGYSDNEEFYNDLRTKRLKTDDNSNYYILQHLVGVHGPLKTNEKCETVEEATLLQTERGCWMYLEEYLNQMKELGVYDDATIIITADHGAHHNYYDGQPIFFMKSPHESHERYTETNAPISFTDIMPTVLYLAGAKYDDLGTTVYEHTEDEQRERTLFIRMHDEDLPDVPKRNSPTNSILNCFYKYVYTGDIEALRAEGKDGPTEKVPWTDSFY